MSKLFYFEQFSLAKVQFRCQTVLVQAIQSSISTQFISILPIDRTLSGANTQGKSGPRRDGNEVVPCIPQASSFTGTSPSDGLVSYLGHSCGKSYPSAEVQSLYSVSADWASIN